MDHPTADLIARRTVARYARAIDSKDFDAIAAIFTEDAQLHRVGTTTVGRSDIATFYRQFLPAVGHMRHFMTNTMAEPDGPLIRVHSLFSYVQVLDEGTRFGWGDYHDVIRPTGEADGEFVDKTIAVVHAEVVPLDVDPTLLPGGIQGI